LKDQEVLIRARVHSSKAQGKGVFINLREQFATVQCVMFINGDVISKGMVEYARRISKESIVDIKARVSIPNEEIKSCT
jgi:aspartyl/asparaginyl-tRNA synthetase